MIANEKQYQITKKKLAEFRSQLVELQDSLSPDNELLHEVYINSLKAKIEDFCNEIYEYESLKEGRLNNISIDSLDDLSTVLIKARIAKGLSQANLADLVNLKEQQIQRYESDSYSTISWKRLVDLLNALEVSFSPIVAKINKPLFDIGDEISQEEILIAQEKLHRKKNILIH
jgi:HTH-type transcriptional regulator / antitoxin HipB